MDITTTIALLGLLVTFVVAVVSAFRYFGAEIAAVRNEAKLLVQATGEAESKARHDLANSLVVTIGKLEQEDRRMADSMNTLALDAVRKAELIGFESRITTAITTSETRFASALDRMDNTRTATLQHMEQKLDRLIEARSGNAAERP